MFKPIIFIAFLLQYSSLQAQQYGTNLRFQYPNDSIYQIHWPIDGSITAMGIGLNAVALISINNLEPRKPSDLMGLQPGQLWGIDEKSIHYESASAKNASDLLAVGSLLLPLAVLADKEMRGDAFQLAVLAAETGILTQGFTNITKRLVLRNRPYVFNPAVPLEKKLEAKSRLSFFSGHTSTTASMGFFTAKIWSDYHPNSRWKPVVWTAAATLPAITGYLRIKAGKHYFTDVVGGYVVGGLVGYFVPHLHQLNRHENNRLRWSVNSSQDGTPMLGMVIGLGNLD